MRSLERPKLELSLSLDDVAVDLSDEKNLLLEDKVVHKHLFRWRRLIAMLPLKCMMKGDGDRADELRFWRLASAEAREEVSPL